MQQPNDSGQFISLAPSAGELLQQAVLTHCVDTLRYEVCFSYHWLWLGYRL